MLRALPTDVFLAAHAQMFDLEGKAARLRGGASRNPFIDPEGYRVYLDGAERAYRDRLSSERPIGTHEPSWGGWPVPLNFGPYSWAGQR